MIEPFHIINVNKHLDIPLAWNVDLRKSYKGLGLELSWDWAKGWVGVGWGWDALFIKSKDKFLFNFNLWFDI
jgi:hypothetical protein